MQKLAILHFCILRRYVRPVNKFHEKIGCQKPQFFLLFVFNSPKVVAGFSEPFRGRWEVRILSL